MKRSASNGLQNVSDNFKQLVKPLLNWKNKEKVQEAKQEDLHHEYYQPSQFHSPVPCAFFCTLYLGSLYLVPFLAP